MCSSVQIDSIDSDRPGLSKRGWIVQTNLDFGFKPSGAVGTALVKDDRNLRLCRKLGVGTLDRVPITLLRFDNEKNCVHKAGQGNSGTHISDGRHVEYDVVKITFLELGQRIVES